jgi:hypothetical protein
MGDGIGALHGWLFNEVKSQGCDKNHNRREGRQQNPVLSW